VPLNSATSKADLTAQLDHFHCSQRDTLGLLTFVHDREPYNSTLDAMFTVEEEEPSINACL
jgi:hypothetical protein